MDNLVQISDLIEKQKKTQEEKKKQDRKRKTDLSASYAAIENCLNFLNMNNIQELNHLKSSMKQTMKTLARLSLEDTSN
jgi:DNA-binding protein H-NS